MEDNEKYFETKNVVMDYYNKKIMAPMVRISTYPMRLLAQRYGCDIVYSEELIDLKVKSTKRVYNEKLNTVDFLNIKDNNLVYRTSELDQKNVMQLGTASAVTALEAATIVSRDVCAIDINMGCPKFFSVQGGMGSALLSKPETIKDILSTLKRNLNKPITCKIRLLSSDQETIDLLRVIESTGVSAIGVHCRTIPERPRDPAHWDRLENILSNASFSVPIIANGDIWKYQDIDSCLNKTKANSVMIARGAIKNVSIFSKPDPLDLRKIIQEYCQLAYETDNHVVNSKYVIMGMLNENNITNNKEVKAMQVSKDYDTITKIWDINDKYQNYLLKEKDYQYQQQEQQQNKEKRNNDQVLNDNNINNNQENLCENKLKKQKVDDNEDQLINN